MVYVYDGDVDYRPTKYSINYRYYWNENGKRCKTRPYVQYSAMTNRCKKGCKQKEIYQCYEKEYLCNDFIPQNIVDEFYSGKNFYKHKLEMLLSNIF